MRFVLEAYTNVKQYYAKCALFPIKLRPKLVLLKPSTARKSGVDMKGLLSLSVYI